MEAKKSKINLKLILIAVGIAVIIAVATAVVLIILNPSKDEGDNNSEDTISTVDTITEEEQQITNETVDKYVEISIEGYKNIDDNPENGKAVIATLKNKSEETVSLAIVIGAFDKDGNLLETSSLYAENITPGQTNNYQLFTASELTPEQLESATYKVFKASTYKADVEPQTEEQVEVQTTEEQTEAPAEENTEETPAEQ